MSLVRHLRLLLAVTLIALVVPLSSARAAAATFTNSGGIIIDESFSSSPPTPARPYPSAINVSGLSGTIQSVTVTLTNLAHPLVGDLDIMLVGPANHGTLLMSDAGGGYNTSGSPVTLTFADAAPQLPYSGAFSSGTYHPTNHYGFDSDSFPGVPPHGGAADLAVFDGSDPNGTWYLAVVDDQGNRSNGGIFGGWSLTIATNEGGGNSPPIAADDDYVATEDSALIVDGGGVLANDRDVENEPLSATLVSPPANGTVSLNADGGFTYRPAANFIGSDSFTYQANDGQAHSNTATVTISVNDDHDPHDLPVAEWDSYAVDEDRTLTVDAPGVLANDNDPQGRTLSAVLYSLPANGTVDLNADGSFTYTPAPNFSGADSFRYRAGAGQDVSAEATVTIAVNPVEEPNTPPTATDDSYSLDEDATLRQAAPGVLHNDTDAEGASLTASLVSRPTHGSVNLNADGSFSYTPATNWSGTDSFTYIASDGTANSNVARVTLRVNPVNSAPNAFDDALTTKKGVAVTIAVLANDADPDGDTLRISAVTQPINGTAVRNANNTITYTPLRKFSGKDRFSYTVSDGKGGTATATVYVTVK